MRRIFSGRPRSAIPAGCSVGICSPSGSGKTTLVDLLLRHYEPDSGCILVDGIDIREFGLGAWRRRIALVAQDIVLFRGSVLDNIRYARPDATDEEVRQAVRCAQLNALVARRRRPGYARWVSRGTRLPVAKSSVSPSPGPCSSSLLVILDEATSAVDVEVEREVLQAVEELFGDCTRLVISHRQSALDNCGYLLAIEGGKLQSVRVLLQVWARVRMPTVMSMHKLAVGLIDSGVAGLAPAA